MNTIRLSYTPTLDQKTKLGDKNYFIGVFWV